MKRKKILALALALTTAFTTLAPNTGFLPAAYVQAASAVHALTYAKGKFDNTEVTLKAGFNVPAAVNLKSAGGSFKLASALEADEDKFVFAGWNVKKGNADPVLYDAGATVTYTADDYDSGVDATAVWRDVVAINKGDIDTLMNSKKSKAYDGGFEMEVESNSIVSSGSSKSKKVTLFVSFDSPLVGSGRTIVLDDYAVMKTVGGKSVVDNDYYVKLTGYEKGDTLATDGEITQASAAMSLMTVEAKGDAALDTDTFTIPAGSNLDDVISISSDVYDSIEFGIEGLADTDGDGDEDDPVYNIKELPKSVKSGIVLYVLAKSTNGGAADYDGGADNTVDTGSETAAGSAGMSGYTIDLIPPVASVKFAEEKDELEFTYSGEKFDNTILNGLVYDKEKLGEVTLKYEKYNESGDTWNNAAEVKDAGTYRAYIASRKGNASYSAPVNAIGTIVVESKDISSSGITVSKIADVKYTAAGAASGIKPASDPSVSDGSTKLTKNTDYEIAYSGNHKATASAVATITGKGNYTGTKTVNYTISKGDAPLTGTLSFTSIGYAGTPVPTGLTNNTEGTVTYYYLKGTDKINTPDKAAVTETGWVTAENTTFTKGTWYAKGTVPETANYEAGESNIAALTVSAKAVKAIKNVGAIVPTEGGSVNIDLSDAEYDTVMDEGIDFTDKNFTLKPASAYISGSSINGDILTINFADDLSGLTSKTAIAGIVEDESNGYVESESENYQVTMNISLTLLPEGTTPVETVLTVEGSTYGDELEAGVDAETYSTEAAGAVVENGVNGNSLSYSYSLDGVTFNATRNTALAAKLKGASNVLDAGTYYLKVVYENTTKNLYGEDVKSFTIEKKPVTITANDATFKADAIGADFSNVNCTSVTYSPEKFPDDTTAIADGTAIGVDTIYTGTVTSGLEDNTVDGTKNGEYKIVVLNQADIVNQCKNYDITFVDGTLTVTGNVTDLSKEGKIDAIGDQAYTGSEVKPAVKVTVGGMTLVEGTDYTVAYSNNTEVGDATVTVTGMGTYVGTLTQTFKIVEDIKEIFYTVKFMDGETELSAYAATVEAGKTVAEPTGVTKDGYTFDGWYTDAALTAAYDFSTAVNADLVLYAKFTKTSSDESKQDDQKQDGQSGTDTTTGSSTDVTPSGSGSGSGGGGGSSNAKTVKNADGSTTTTTTTAKGTIETTTKTNADGSKTTSKVVKNKDGSGSVTETSVSAAGTTKVVEVVTDTTGAATEVTTTVSNAKGASMKVTYAAKGTAITVSKVETTGKTAVSIPATVKVGGKTYKVTKIAASALKGNKEITKVTLGKNIKAIGKNAFNGDSKLKTIVMKKAPTTVGKNAFKGIAKKATIKIKATKKAFKTAKTLIKKSGIASTVKIKRSK